MKYLSVIILVLLGSVAIFSLVFFVFDPEGESTVVGSGGLQESVSNAESMEKDRYREHVAREVPEEEEEERSTHSVEGREYVSEPLKVQEQPAFVDTDLSVQGVISWSNIQRVAEGVSGELTENSLLNSVAEVKLNDMFERQYFAHYDTSGGMGAGSIAHSEGYEYILIGENLALGNFEDDRVLVQAWMDSPGHRENILKQQYTEIGVAVGKGRYEGRDTWMAVQIFGRPMSDCPRVDQDLQSSIDDAKIEIAELDGELEERQRELEEWKGPHNSQYRQAIHEYNEVIEQYNVLIEEVQSMIEEYNNQVDAFNSCIAS